jgi:hypothetical protein
LTWANILAALRIVMLFAALEQPAGGTVKAPDERDRPVVVQIEDVNVIPGSSFVPSYFSLL